MVNLSQKENHILRVRRSFEYRETEIKIVTTRTACNETEHRVVVTSRCLKKDWRFANRCPSRADIRPKGNSAFVP